MIYNLKTSSKCNNNCIYCDNLRKKSPKNKKLNEIRQEIDRAAQNGFSGIKYSCNTDVREDFIEIVKYAKTKNLKNILETNARMFCYTKTLITSQEHIDEYEVYFSFGEPQNAKFINKIQTGFFEQSILGLRNLINKAGADKVVAKIVIMNLNINEMKKIIRNVVSVGTMKIEFISPFNLEEDDRLFLLMSELTQTMPEFIEYATQLGAEIKYSTNLEYSPFKVDEPGLLDTETSCLQYKKQKYKKKPIISVIIPTKNKNSYLKLVLESFLNQTLDKSKYEIIVINDGGGKDTKKVIEAFDFPFNFKYIYWPTTKYKNNKYISKYSNLYNRAGLARNIGVSYAEGDIVLFNDDDILVKKDNLEKHLNKHLENDNLIVRGYRKYLKKEYFPKKLNFKEINKDAIEELGFNEKILRCKKHQIIKAGWENFVTCNLSISKNLFKQAGGFNCDSPFWGLEDVELGYRLKDYNPILDWDSEISIYHLWHKPQTIDEYNKNMIFWINTNIFFRKYFDPKIYYIFSSTILNNFDKNIFK